MIAYLEGQLLNKDEERILLLAGQVGYEVLLPAFVMRTLDGRERGAPVAFYIYYHQTERQPKPVLIGFNLEAEKEFFQHFISVEAIGPLKAVKALTMPIREVARAIEQKDVGTLSRLKGIGNRTAQKIIATLEGRVGKFALIRKEVTGYAAVQEDFTQPVYDVLVNQLGHKPADARDMIAKALERNPVVQTPGALFDEVYRNEADR
ncbi:MAG: Holliday junction branch migration protein RuvA [Thermodesulfobacteriota bacterium]